MKDRLTNFLRGRYGPDALTKFLMYFAIIILMLYYVTKIEALSIISLAILLIANFRIFSKNIEKRSKENTRFLNLVKKITNPFLKFLNKDYKYFTCEFCKQDLRVPKGKGKINVKCPKCGKKYQITS